MITEREKNVKGIAKVVRATKGIDAKNQWNTKVPMYYNFSKNEVFLDDGKGREIVTYFLNPCDEADVREALHGWLWA